MSSYSDQLAAKAHTVLTTHIEIIEKDFVPETSDLKLEKNQGFEVEATYLYADLVGSSTLAQRAYKPVTAKIIRSYINGAADILRHYGGEIRSFDGDRVMAIYMGTEKETNAVRAALAVNWLVEEVLGPKVSQTWADLDFWPFKHSIGIDTGQALVTRGGVRGHNDLISIGAAPNVAAKLSDLRDGHALHITQDVYGPMSNEVAFHEKVTQTYLGQELTTQVPMWVNRPATNVGGTFVNSLASNWYWGP